jgi:hypothetical protein
MLCTEVNVMTYIQSQHYSTDKPKAAWTDTTLGAAHFVTVIVQVLQFLPPSYHTNNAPNSCIIKGWYNRSI